MESEAATLRLSLRHSGDEAVITLTDNGPSLPAEYAEQVFEPFFSLDESRRSLGLGLTVTRMILERAGGRVMASFREGYGTTISLILPLQPGLELRSGKLPSASAGLLRPGFGAAHPALGHHRAAHAVNFCAKQEQPVRSGINRTRGTGCFYSAVIPRGRISPA